MVLRRVVVLPQQLEPPGRVRSHHLPHGHRGASGAGPAIVPGAAAAANHRPLQEDPGVVLTRVNVVLLQVLVVLGVIHSPVWCRCACGGPVYV